MRKEVEKINKWLEFNNVDCRVYAEAGFFEVSGKDYFTTCQNACEVVQEIGFYMASRLANQIGGYACVCEEKGASVIKVMVDKEIFTTVEITCLGVYGNITIAKILNKVIEIFVPSKTRLDIGVLATLGLIARTPRSKLEVMIDKMKIDIDFN